MGLAIGKITRVPVRDVWKHEAYDFTTWMEDNIDVLNEVIDLTLVAIEREKKTESSFSVDLVAEDSEGQTVIIENQYGKSDHDHLGKVLTYLASQDAAAAIWIAEDPRPEHVAAIDWLNRSGEARFYLIKVEAIKIGASEPAPLFTTIVQPSDDVVSLKESRHANSERHQIRLEWWTKLLGRDDASLHSAITPGGYSYISTSSGVRGLNFNYTITQKSAVAELYIDRGKNQAVLNQSIFEALEANKQQIEQSCGEPLSWEPLEAKRACRIKIEVSGGYRNDRAEWDKIQSAQVAVMNKLHEALAPHIKNMDIKSMEDELEQTSNSTSELETS